MSTKTEQFNKLQLKNDLPDIKPGDTVRIHQKIKESLGKAQDKGEKERIQVFEGVVIARKHGKGISSTITVRKVVDGVGVERVLPVHSPSIARMEIVKSGKVRRAKLYYLRHTKGKKARLKKRDFSAAIVEEKPSVQTTEEAIPETASEVEKTE